MTDDEQNTARELIENALSDLTTNAQNIETPLDLVKMVAASIRDNDEHRDALEKQAPHALLMEWQIEQYGRATDPNDNREKTLGGLGVRALATCQTHEPDLLDYLLAGEKTYAYALASAVRADDGELGVIVLAATRDGWQIAGVAATDPDRTCDAYIITRETAGLTGTPPDLLATLEKLAAAVARKAAE